MPCRRVFLAACAVLAAALPVVAAAADAPVAGITAPNVVPVSPLLVTAGQPTAESLAGLKAQGYDAVVYLAPFGVQGAVADEPAILQRQGIEFVHVPIPWDQPEEAHFRATAAALDRLKGRKVLVHCQMNMRASAITFLYRAIVAKEDPATAWADVKKVWTPRDRWATFVQEQLRGNGIAFRAE